ncbi:dihydroorotate dehydrogenase-like protein [Bacteroidales bacterium]|nr:dihydroorotate dehydrogenase-like protein [Bacteroidales bacterium]
MKNLSTTYLGIDIESPIVIGASNLSKSLDNIKAAGENGAGAIVYKSLFEEQVHLDAIQLQDELMEFNDRNAEMTTIFPSISHAGPEIHLNELRKTKEASDIPIIASLNAIYKETWVEYAELIEQTGVDAIELNFYAVPRLKSITGNDIVEKVLSSVQAVKEKVKIPISVKLSPFYANPLNVIDELDMAGVNGVVLFNRFFQPDIDIETEQHFSPFNLSAQHDDHLALRFAGLLYGEINADIIANTGIYTGEDVVKMILAGANSVQVVSTLYKNKIPYLKTMLEEISGWMDEKGYTSLSDFRGKLSRNKVSNPYLYKRAQYIDMLLNPEGIVKQYQV